jgi:phosphoserine aminotransferase
MMEPTNRPRVPHFSSGPCAKRPGWTVDVLKDACLGRSHRSKQGKAKLKEAIDRTRALLGVPADYKIGIVAASDTGAVEMAMWSMLGAKPIDILAWESFGSDWVTDVVKQLKLKDVRTIEAPYGALPDLTQVDFKKDVVFLWNGTTSGVKVPNGEWIAADREGLTICDATSAVFAMDLPWDKLDVTTYSWQKVLGGEAQHGILILSPRAVQRLETYTPPWPMPKLFRMTKGGKLQEDIFEGATINTPSMLCVEDVIDAMKWADSIGGLKGLIARSNANLAAVSAWVKRSEWTDFLAHDEAVRSNTSICLKIVDPWFAGLADDQQQDVIKKIVALIEKNGVGYDIAGYRSAPAGFRLWGGATVETGDLEALFPWMDWAFAQVKAAAANPA